METLPLPCCQTYIDGGGRNTLPNDTEFYDCTTVHIISVSFRHTVKNECFKWTSNQSPVDSRWLARSLADVRRWVSTRITVKCYYVAFIIMSGSSGLSSSLLYSRWNSLATFLQLCTSKKKYVPRSYELVFVIGSIPGARVIHTRSSLWYLQSLLYLHADHNQLHSILCKDTTTNSQTHMIQHCIERLASL